MVKHLFILYSLVSFADACIAQVVEERTTVHRGVVETCGEGPGIESCRDISGEDYDEEMSGPDFKTEEDNKMAERAERIRNESPEELEETISELEKE